MRRAQVGTEDAARRSAVSNGYLPFSPAVITADRGRKASRNEVEAIRPILRFVRESPGAPENLTRNDQSSSFVTIGGTCPPPPPCPPPPGTHHTDLAPFVCR